MVDLPHLLRFAQEKGASDLHLKAGAVPHLRLEGELVPISDLAPLTAEQLHSLTQSILDEEKRHALSQRSEVDLALNVDGLGRFRLAVFHQRGSLAMVFRLIPPCPLSFEELHLPPVLEEIAGEARGLILVTGATGSGKSTTLAALIQHLNQTRSLHILTIEDPIEYLIPDQLSLVTQREVGADTEDFASALRAALRQDPDVIMVGEMRDPETVQTALQAAETGHLVLSTLHTTDALETVHRIVSMFEQTHQNDVRLRLAASLRAIISMRLVKSSVTGKRLPAVEILRNTELIRSLIEQPNRTKEIRGALEMGSSQYGMQSFDQSLYEHYRNGLITREDALRYATSPEDLKLRIQGIVSSSQSV